MATIYDFKVAGNSGDQVDFADYQGKVVLIVNTASKCGFAPQFADLEKLYQKYQQQGLMVVGLPSNQFRQELAAGEDAAEYCQLHYGVTFPITDLVKVNGAEADPLFKFLKQQAGHGRIKWNFTKFLIGRDGRVLERYAPVTKPSQFEDAIRNALAEVAPDPATQA